MMKFGIERLLADHVLQKPLAGRRVALLANPASVTASLTHSLDSLASLPDIKLTAAFGPATWAARRQAGQHDRVGGLHRSGARHPGVQPVRQGAPADRSDAGDLRHPARGPAGRGLPRLHLPDDAPLPAGRIGARGQGHSRAGSSQPDRTAHRRARADPRLGKLRRRRRDADAPWHDARGTGRLVRRKAQARRGLRNRDDGWLATRGTARLRMAADRARLGQSESQCARILRWRAATRAR